MFTLKAINEQAKDCTHTLKRTCSEEAFLRLSVHGTVP